MDARCGLDAEHAGGVGDSEGGVAAGGDDEVGSLAVVEAREVTQVTDAPARSQLGCIPLAPDAPRLEGPGRLGVLQLEEDVAVRSVGQGRTIDQGCSAE